MGAYRSSKTFGHDLGLSACFRQWRAKHSHCQYLHGYALAVHLEFEADQLDERNWVVDFGSFDTVKEFLRHTFDHKLLVAEDDPQRDTFEALGALGLAQVLVLPAVGCEKFAQYVHSYVRQWLRGQYGEAIRLVSVTVREHGANSAEYRP
jgi:6-pyruvoyltetrahydropterin/6-carboxytetrahydropterin synthase